VDLFFTRRCKAKDLYHISIKIFELIFNCLKLLFHSISLLSGDFMFMQHYDNLVLLKG